MQKNVMVQDAAGQIIGSTYSKRAKGLLKSGRAVLVDDHTIQLCASAQNTAAPISKIYYFVHLHFQRNPVSAHC